MATHGLAIVINCMLTWQAAWDILCNGQVKALHGHAIKIIIALL